MYLTNLKIDMLYHINTFQDTAFWVPVDVPLSIFAWTQSNLNLKISGSLNFDNISLSVLLRKLQL